MNTLQYLSTSQIKIPALSFSTCGLAPDDLIGIIPSSHLLSSHNSTSPISVFPTGLLLPKAHDTFAAWKVVATGIHSELWSHMTLTYRPPLTPPTYLLPCYSSMHFSLKHLSTVITLTCLIIEKRGKVMHGKVITVAQNFVGVLWLILSRDSERK